MFGKYLNKFVVSAVIIICSINTTFAYNKTILINGHQNDVESPSLNKALRLQGIGDFFFKKKSYAQSVPYYEEALTILPKEADITFRLAEVYQHEKLWRLSILYYESTIELLRDPVNFSKSQLNSYISRIRIAYVYHLQGNKERAIADLREIRKELPLLISSYPEAYKELQIFDNIYPETAVRKTN